MANMTQAEVNAFLARSGTMPMNPNLVLQPKSAFLKESELHKNILAACKIRGWIAFHGSMAHSTFRTEGEPDFVILMPNGRTLMIECKSKKGKSTAEQLAIHAWARTLDHTVHVIRSMEEFYELIKP